MGIGVRSARSFGGTRWTAAARSSRTTVRLRRGRGPPPATRWIVFVPGTRGSATASHRSATEPSLRRIRRCRPRSERTRSPPPPARAGPNLSQRPPSRPQTVTTRGSGPAAARWRARSSPCSQRTLPGSTASRSGASVPARWVALRSIPPSGRRPSGTASVKGARIPRGPEPRLPSAPALSSCRARCPSCRPGKTPRYCL